MTWIREHRAALSDGCDWRLDFTYLYKWSGVGCDWRLDFTYLYKWSGVGSFIDCELQSFGVDEYRYITAHPLHSLVKIANHMLMLRVCESVCESVCVWVCVLGKENFLVCVNVPVDDCC
jgi:hypothetical protein